MFGIITAASLTLPAVAETIGLGTVWNTAAMNGQASSGTTVGFWAPNNQGSVTGFTLTPNGAGLNHGGSASGTVYLHSLVGVNATSGTGTTGFLTVIDAASNTIVGSSTNALTSIINATQSTLPPWQFNNLALDSTRRYALIFTATAGIPGNVVTTIPADGGAYSSADIDTTAATLATVNYRIGGGANNTSNLIAGSGAFNTAGSAANYEQWFSAAFTTTAQTLTTLDSGAGTITQSGPGSWNGIRKVGTGTYVLNDTGNANTGDIVVENGVLRLDTAAAGTTSALVGGAGQVFLAHSNGGATAVSQNSTAMNGSILQVDTSAGDATLDTAVEGAGRLVKTGTNTLFVTVNGSQTGGVRVEAGVLSISSIANKGVDSPLGRGNNSNSSLVLAGGTLVYTGAAGSTDRTLGLGANATNTLAAEGTGALGFTSTATIGFNGQTGARTLHLVGANTGNNTLANVLADNGGATTVEKRGEGKWILSGNNTHTGGVVIHAGTLQMGAGGTSGALGSGPVSVAGTLAFNRTDGGVLVVANNLSGAGLITHSAPQLALTGVNTFSGTLEINSGTLALRSIGSIAGEPKVVVNAGGNLALGNDFAGQSATISSLSGAGGVNPQFDQPTGVRTLVVNQAVDTEFSGVARDATTGSRTLALTKDGAGTLTLSGANTYNGSTRVLAGALTVNGSLGGTGLVSVASAAVLGGKGSIAGPVIVQAGGRLEPGDGVGALALNGNLDVQGIMQIETSGTTNDVVNGVAALQLGPSSELKLVGTLVAASRVILRYTSRSGAFADVSDVTAQGYAVVYDDAAGQIRLQAPPAVLTVPATPAPGLSWPTRVGRVYTLQYRPDLSTGDWSNVPGYTDLPGTGSPITLPALITPDPRGYYRMAEW